MSSTWDLTLTERMADSTSVFWNIIVCGCFSCRQHRILGEMKLLNERC